MFRLRLSLAITATLFVMTTTALAQTTLKIDGSTGAMPLVDALARAYAAKTPSVDVDIGKGLGTQARIDALKSGNIDFAVASHGLKIDELVKQGMAVHEIARTAVIFGVNSSVSISNLSQSQICSIYSGASTNWQQLGGPDLLIVARTRPDSEVDTEVVRDGIACLKSMKMPEPVKVMQRGGDMAKELAGTVGAIGMTTATVAEQSGGKIKSLALDGAAPTEANISAGAYRLVREVFLVVKETRSSAAQAFLAFVRSAEGAAVIKANGALPKAGT